MSTNRRHRPQLLAQLDVVDTTVDAHNSWVVSNASSTCFYKVHRKISTDRLHRLTGLWNILTGPFLRTSESWISMSQHMLHMKRYAYSANFRIPPIR